MSLVRAPQLGIERFANDRDKESWSIAASEDKDTIIRSVYQQVLGQQHLMASERLTAAESLFRHGYLDVRDLVRTIAQSGLYRAKFFENCNAYRFIELNHKHLLGRAPHNRAEMLHHFTILQEQGVDAEIDSYIDSSEYMRRFGQNVVPYIHGWDYSSGHEGRQFSWLLQLARGSAASVKGSPTGNQAALNRALHQNRAVPVRGAAPAVRVSSGPAIGHYRFLSTEGPFQALLAEGSGLYGDQVDSGERHTPGQGHRQESLRVTAGAPSSDRLVTIRISGVVQQAVVRTGEVVLRVPFRRMNEALQRAHRLGQVTSIQVS
jgi:hypothetical protein